MAFAIVTECLSRIEHKLDLILRALQFLDSTPIQPMHFTGHQCPVCKNLVDYTVDLGNQVVVRRCGCHTGKQPPLISLVPVQQTGATNGNPTGSERDGQGDPPEDRPRRKGR